MRWPMTFYTDRFVPSGSDACMRILILPVIFIRPSKRDDLGLYRHELTHVKQAFIGLLVLHTLAYLMSDDYRLECEVDAYREQAKHYPDDRRPLFAGFIASKYGLSITIESALALLNE